MTREVLINAGLIETRVALLEDERLVELNVAGPWNALEESLVGGVFIGRVTKVVKGIDGAFVDIGAGVSAFLSGRDAQSLAAEDDGRERVPIESCVSEGERVVVQVRADALGDKGPRVTAEIAVPGRYVVLTPYGADVVVSRRLADARERERLAGIVTECVRDLGGDVGFVVRTAAEGVAREALAAEARRLADAWRRMDAAADEGEDARRLDAPLAVHERALVDIPAGVIRIIIDDRAAHEALSRLARERYPDIVGAFELDAGADPFERHAIEEEIDIALGPRVMLPSGGSIVIEETEALTAVDVNSGASAAGAAAGNVGLRTNLEAADEVARQLRLREIGGLVVVDFLRLHRPADCDRLIAAVREAMAGDPQPHKIGSLTPFGLLELTRRRHRDTLANRLTEPTGAAMRVPALRSMAARVVREIERAAATERTGSIEIRLAADLARWLEGPGDAAMAVLQERLGRAVTVTAEAGWPRDKVEIVMGRNGA